MKAIILKSAGEVENLVTADLPIPDITEHEVLIKSRAIGINPVDIKTRKGKSLYSSLSKYDPLILGWDVSGTVIRTGSLVKSFKEGDEVFGMVYFPGHGKTYAEYVAAREDHITLKPMEISHEDAAAACLAALTAWQILKEKLNIKSGDRILIHAAAGGVGHYAVQMAKYLGAEVTGTASGRNMEFVMDLGVDKFIDYEKQPFENDLHDLDYVLDSIGGEYSERSFNVLKPGGTLVIIPTGGNEKLFEEASKKGISAIKFLVESNGKNMKEIAFLLGNGSVKSHISGKFPLENAREAHLQIETGKTRGKIVLIP